jgi:hypothetical protein
VCVGGVGLVQYSICVDMCNATINFQILFA